MNKLISTLILLITLSSCIQEKKCSEFRTGEFTYTDNANQLLKVVRTDVVQIEINPKTGVEIHTLIDWTSKCEFTLTYAKILNHPDDVSNIIGKKIYVKIIEINGNRYKVNARSNSMNEDIEFIKVK